MRAWQILFTVCGIAAVIVFVCLIVEKCRIYAFRVLKVDRAVEQISLNILKLMEKLCQNEKKKYVST